MAVVATVSLVLLGGCTTAQKAPSNYAGAEDNFLEGCEQIAKSDNGKDGVEYSEFKKIQSRMQDEGGALPKSYLEVVDRCDPAEKASS